MEDLKIIIRAQNMNLLRLIAHKEGWNYTELCQKYLT